MSHPRVPAHRARVAPAPWFALVTLLICLAACGGTPIATTVPATSTVASGPAPTASIAPAPATRRPTQATTPARPTPTAPARTTAAPRATVPAAATATRAATGAAGTARASATITFGVQPAFARGGLEGEALTTVVVGGADARTIYAGGKGVWRSTDGGKSWQVVHTAEEAPYVSTIVIAPSDPRVVYIGVSQGCGRGGKLPGFATTDGGKNWRAIGQNIASLAVDPLDAKKLYATDCTGVQRSTDGGTTWDTLNSAVVADYTPTLLALAPNSPQTLYVAFASEGGTVRVRRTINAGAAWQEITPNAAVFGPLALVIEPGRSDSVFLSTLVGVFRTTDGGARWSRLKETGLETTAPSSPPPNSPEGFRLTGALIIDPSQPSNLWLGTGSGSTPGIGVFRSRDGGANWKQTGVGLEERAVQDFAITTTRTTSTLYVATDDGIWVLTTPY